MTVWLGNYNVPNDAGAAYVRQRDVIKDALQTYGTDNIGGITVGNEFILKYVSFRAKWLHVLIHFWQLDHRPKCFCE